jgi:hypothetical protein
VSELAAIVEAGDLDELTRLVDRLCAARDWDALLDLRDRCRRALERGRQLWPAASHAEYRLALEAPGEYAARVLVEGTGHLALGPLAEVAASTHTWAELAPFVDDGPVAAIAAHERVVRGEDLRDARVVGAEVFALPLRLEPWEPEYAVPVYRADRVELTGPIPPRGRPLATSPPGERLADDDAVLALRDVVRAWTIGSEGSVRAVAVRGGAASAIGALVAGGVRAAWLGPAEAMALLAWAGASGGTQGRRRGAAAGRDLAWAAAAALAGFTADDPPDPGALGEAIADLRWLWWGTDDVGRGWILRLAVEDPDDHLAWAVDALDPA